MAIDFPNSPTTNQLYTVGSRSWKWDGDTWNIYAATPAIYVQDSAPTSPIDGDQWYESDTGRWFLRYQSVWVEIGNTTDVAGALQPSQVTALSAVTSLTSDDVFPVVDGPSGAVASSKITYGNLVTNMSSSLAPGLVLVKAQTVGTAVSSVTVSDAFSSTYDNYRIIYTGGNSSVDNDLKMTLGASTSGYYAGFAYVAYASGTVTGVSNNNATSWAYIGSQRTVRNSLDVDLFGPFLAIETGMTARYFGITAGAVGGAMGGYHNLGTSYTSFTITCTSGNITGGTIRVYGYRNS